MCEGFCTKSKLLIICLSVAVLWAEFNVAEGVFMCKRCGESVAQARHLVSLPSKLALQRWNNTISGKKNVMTQKFENPEGRTFELATFSKALVESQEEAHSEATWFPGYSWRISVCPRCHGFLGWKYQPENFNHVTCSEDSTFYGLIMSHLAQEVESDSLIVVQSPNSR